MTWSKLCHLTRIANISDNNWPQLSTIRTSKEQNRRDYITLLSHYHARQSPSQLQIITSFITSSFATPLLKTLKNRANTRTFRVTSGAFFNIFWGYNNTSTFSFAFCSCHFWWGEFWWLPELFSTHPQSQHGWHETENDEFQVVSLLHSPPDLCIILCTVAYTTNCQSCISSNAAF